MDRMEPTSPRGGTEPTAGPTGPLALIVHAAVQDIGAETCRLRAAAAARRGPSAWELGCDEAAHAPDASLAAGIIRALAHLSPEEIAALESGLQRLLEALRVQPGGAAQGRAAGTRFRPPPIS